MTITRISEVARLHRLTTLVNRLPATLTSRVMKSMTSRERIALSNLFRHPVGPRRLTDAEIAARLQARGIDPKFMPQEV